jgi:hypothetical protein
MDLSRSRRLLIGCVATVLALGVAGLAAAGAGAVTVTTVASGLDNPRALSFGPEGHLYVAEAGHGGSTCLPPEPGEEPFCTGFTGGIGLISNTGTHRRVVDGVISFAGEEGIAATGLDGVNAHGNYGLLGLVTESIPGLERLGFPLKGSALAEARSQVGRLLQGNGQGGPFRPVAPVGDVDFRWTEEHFAELGVDQPPDANPYAVYASGNEVWIVDAAANILDQVRPYGPVHVVAFIPSPPVSDSVPTCLDRGPDGAFYVGELTGFGNGPGKSVVWRVVPGHAPEVWATGLTGVTGCGFGSDGEFYAVEFSTLGWESFAPGTGAVVRVPPHSSKPTLVVGGLSFPNGFAPGPNGTIYVSNWSVAPANNGGGPTGEVVRITP